MKETDKILNHLFRTQSGQITAYLMRVFGPDKMDFAENVVQEALLKAVQTWPINGIPENPAAWITSVAKNIAIDNLRKDKYLAFDSDVYEAVLEVEESVEQSKHFQNELSSIDNDQLKLIFICCHPILSQEAQVALALKTVSGFSVGEIAKAFLSKEETIAQRLVRAKLKIKESKIVFENPPPEKIGERIASVLDVFYLIYNEGYLASEGDDLIRKDLCEEAIRLTTLLFKHPLGDLPQTAALLSLMHFQYSRFNSRIDENGDLVLLEDQDRSQWDQRHISLGLKYLDRSSSGSNLTEYHLQAGIASVHAMAQTFATTHWSQIIEYYDLLCQMNPSPVIALNRAVAIAMRDGPEAGLKEIDLIKNDPQLKNYYLLHGTVAELNRKLGKTDEAIKYYQLALKLIQSKPERNFIEKRLASIGRDNK